MKPMIAAYYMCIVVVNPEERCKHFQKCLDTKSTVCLCTQKEKDTETMRIRKIWERMAKND